MKEIVIPITMKEVFNEGGKRYITCRPQINVRCEEIYIGTESYRLEEPIVTVVGEVIWVPVPSSHASQVSKETVCGVFASEITENGTVLSSGPIAGSIVGEFEPGELSISQSSAAEATFEPRASSGTITRFKHLDFKVVSGDASKVFLNDLKVGTNSIFSSGPPGVPLWTISHEGALSLPKGSDMSPGILFTVRLSNLGTEPAVIKGNIVFEEIPIPKSTTESAVQN